MVLLEIVIECSPDDVGSPALNGLALTILNIEGGQLDLEKISETTWKHGVVVEMYIVHLLLCSSVDYSLLQTSVNQSTVNRCLVNGRWRYRLCELHEG